MSELRAVATPTQIAVSNLRLMSALADDSGICIVDARDLNRALDALALFESMPLNDHAATVKQIVGHLAAGDGDATAREVMGIIARGA